MKYIPNFLDYWKGTEQYSIQIHYVCKNGAWVKSI